ncbi:hypothetical protein BHE74_00049199 [Ensete ventricosum]|nr:hypothetical protein GW17_00040205 [Ensete ventricosum]RWW45000.1 hypothetical protein BHE74_00049199 [Ensete ventricosum]
MSSYCVGDVRKVTLWWKQVMRPGPSPLSNVLAFGSESNPVGSACEPCVRGYKPFESSKALENLFRTDTPSIAIPGFVTLA